MEFVADTKTMKLFRNEIDRRARGSGQNCGPLHPVSFFRLLFPRKRGDSAAVRVSKEDLMLYIAAGPKLDLQLSEKQTDIEDASNRN